MQQIAVSALLLTAIIMALSLLVLLARRVLGVSGTVSVSLDDGRVLEFPAGRRLLWALADEGIRLPAACGGKGACGLCRVRIDEGQPELSLMGAEHIGPQDAAAGFRLACMVRVWADMRIAVNTGSMQTGHWRCEVVSNRNISVYLNELVLQLPPEERITFAAGNYILLEVPPYRLRFCDIPVDPRFAPEWERLDLFGLESEVAEPTVRAYSLANPPQQDREIRLVVRIATPPASAPANTPPGRASSYIFNLRPGDYVDISGPFGTFKATDSDREMVLIAGGAGIAPIRSIILDQLERNTGRRMSLWFGARDFHDLAYYEEFQRRQEEHANFRVQAVLSDPRDEDQWRGETGFVHAVLGERYLDQHPAPGEAEYYLCGPPLMAAAVLQMLDELGVGSERIFLDDFGS